MTALFGGFFLLIYLAILGGLLAGAVVLIQAVVRISHAMVNVSRTLEAIEAKLDSGRLR